MHAHRLRAIVTLLGTALTLVLVTPRGDDPSPAQASGIGGVAAYISPPFVQGPPATFGASIETFDGLATGACNLTTLNSSTTLGTFTGGCSSWNGADPSTPWGGAQTTSDTPTVGSQGAPSPSRYISPPPTGGLTLTFGTPAKYFGFWWSAGSASDTVTLYGSDPNTPIVTYTLATINSLLGGPTPPTSASAYSSLGTVRSIGGTEYNKSRYWGRPWNYPDTSPTALWSTNVNANIYLHAYINTFAAGSTAFTKVTFSSQSFEFDNLAVATTPQSPPSSLVFLESLVGKSVEFRANGGTGSMMAQTSDAATTLSPNAFTRAGYTFAGWHSNSSGTGGTDYADGAQYPFTNDTVLHARWTPNTLTVTYDTGGGSVITSGTTTTGSNIAASPGTPTRAGHTFDGWFTAPTGGSALTFPYTHGQTANFTLYAQWTAVATPSPSTSTTTSTTAPTSTATPAPTTTTAAPASTSSTVATASGEAVSEQAAQESSPLPVTGSTTRPLAALAVALLVSGLVVARRRPTPSTERTHS